MMGEAYHYVLELLGHARVPARRFYLEPGSYLIGSLEGAEVHLPARGISRRHARLEIDADGAARLEDLGSRNGTYVGDRRIESADVTAGGLLRFGQLVAELERLDPAHARIAIAAEGERDAGAMASGSVAAGVSTVEDSLEQRFLRSVRQALGRRLAGGSDAAAAGVEMVRSWIAEGLADRVELARDGELGESYLELGARAADGPHEPDAEVAGDGGLRLRLWGPRAERLARSGRLMQIALDLATSDGAAAPVRRPRRDDSPPPLPAPGSLNRELIEVYRRAAKIARGEIPVLVLGESGTGKEVISRWIHGAAGGSGAPFVALNCAALPKELLEAELFGIEKGVATGVEARRGLIEEADGGTLMLDEIGDMALETQGKVLRVLEDRQVFRVGGRTAHPVDARWISATNKDLAAEIEEGTFRRDLYHRLAAFVIELPPLRSRREDVPLLAAHFFREETERRRRASPGITRSALETLLAYDWPGNVRELQNEIAKAVLLLDEGEPLDRVHLSPELTGAGAPGPGERPLTLESALKRAEREAFSVALAVAGGDHARAMEQLGVSRATFYRKLKSLGLN